MENKTLNKLFIIIAVILLILVAIFSRTSYSNNIDKLAYAIAIGIDVGKNSSMQLSIQFSSTNEASSGSGSSQSSEAIVYSVECSDINDGMNLINNYLSKRINLAHTRVIVFSEEFAATGVSDVIYTLINSVQIRPTANIVVSKCYAREFLQSASSKLEKLSARYYETIPNSSEYTGYTQNISISQFFYDIQNTRKNASAILGAVNTEASHSSANSEQESGKYTAGQAPINSEDPGIENTGLAVFIEDKLVGELNNIETICHLLASNNLHYCNITIPNPLNVSDTIDLRLSTNSPVKKKIKIVNGNPFIILDFNISCQLISMSENVNYFSEENIRKIEDAVNVYIKQNMTKYLYKTSKELKADIAGLGKTAIHQFVTWNNWIDYKWLEKYKNAFFDINVNSELKSGQLLIET